MGKTAIKELSFENYEGDNINVIAWQDEDTEEITLSIDNDETMESIEIGTIMDIYQLKHILDKILKKIDK